MRVLLTMLDDCRYNFPPSAGGQAARYGESVFYEDTFDYKCQQCYLYLTCTVAVGLIS